MGRATIRQWYAEFTLMCGGILFTKKPDSRCLIGKTPGLNRTLVYNHIETHSNASCGQLVFNTSVNTKGL